MTLCDKIIELYVNRDNVPLKDYVIEFFGEEIKIREGDFPLPLMRVSKFIGMRESAFSSFFKDNKNKILGFKYESILLKVELSLVKAFGKIVANRIIKDYMEDRGRRHLLFYSITEIFYKCTHKVYLKDELSSIIYSNERKKQIYNYLMTPNPKISDIAVLWKLEYNIYNLKRDEDNGFDVSKKTIEKIQKACKKLIRLYAFKYNVHPDIQENPLIFDVIWQSLYAISEVNEKMAKINELSKEISRKRHEGHIIGTVFGDGQLYTRPAKTLLHFLLRSGVRADHEAVIKIKEYLINYSSLPPELTSDSYLEHLSELSNILENIKTVDESSLTTSQKDRFRTILFEMCGRCWVNGEEFSSVGEILLHHIAHDKYGKTLYDDKSNPKKYFDVLSNLAPVLKSENLGLEKKINEGISDVLWDEWEARFAKTWEQLLRGDIKNMFKWWKKAEDRINFQRKYLGYRRTRLL